MKEKEGPKNIYQKLAAIRKQVEVIKTNKKGFGYYYVTDDEILSKITGFMDKYHLSLMPRIVHDSVIVRPYTYKKTKATNQGDIYEEICNEIIVNADMYWCWINNDDPDERVDIPWAIIGQQGDAAQAFGSSLTYSHRYFLLKFFNIATPDDDPDNFRSKQQAALKAEDKMVADQIIKDIDIKVRSYLETSPDKAEAVKKFIGKYAKGGDYFKIADPILAAKLLDDFQIFIKER